MTYLQALRSPGHAQRRARVGDQLVCGGLVLLAMALLLYRVALQPVDPDELGHLHSAWQWHRGLRPYVDFGEHHPPLYWLLLRPLVAHFEDGRDLLGVLTAARAQMVLTVGAGAAATVLAAAELFASRRAGWFAAAAWALFCTLSDRAIHARPDMPMLVLLVLGTYLGARGTALTRDDRRPSWRWAAAGGVVVALAVGMSTKAALWVVALSLSVVLAPVVSRARRERAHLAATAAFLLGGVAAGLLMLGWVVVFNDWDAFWLANFTRNRPALGMRMMRPRGASLIPPSLSWAMPPAPVAAVGIVLLLAQRHATRAIAVLLGTLGGYALTRIAISPWHHYHFPLLWWLAALTGFAVFALSFRGRGRVGAAWGALVALPWAWSIQAALIPQGDDLAASLRSYRLILARAQPGDTMIALGHRNPVFVPSAAPLLWMRRMVGTSPELDRRFIAAIEQVEPRFVILAPFRKLRADHRVLFTRYRALDRLVLERLPAGAPRTGVDVLDDLYRRHGGRPRRR